MAKILSLVLVLVISILGDSTKANATLITFDDLSAGYVPNGYNGFNWSNIFVMNPYPFHQNDGFYYGRVSGPNVAFNVGAFVSIYSSTPFTLNSGYFTTIQPDQNITIRGYLNDVMVEEIVAYPTNTGPTYFALNMANVDRVEIYPYLNYLYVVMDNLDITITPLPAALPLFGAGVLGLAGWVRKKKA